MSAWSSRPERQLWPQGHVYCDESRITASRWPGPGFCPGAPGAAEAKSIDPGRLWKSGVGRLWKSEVVVVEAARRSCLVMKDHRHRREQRCGEATATQDTAWRCRKRESATAIIHGSTATPTWSDVLHGPLRHCETQSNAAPEFRKKIRKAKAQSRV